MPTIPRSQNHLAELLGIAKSICSRHKGRGMPTDSLEAARAWMQANLDPARRKGSRFDKHYQAPPPKQRLPTLPTEPTLAAQASALMDAASALLESDQTIEPKSGSYPVAGMGVWAGFVGIGGTIRSQI